MIEGVFPGIGAAATISQAKGYWLPMLFGLLSLLVLQSVMVKGRQQGKRTVAAFFFALCASVAIFGVWVQPPRFLPTASTSGQVVRMAHDLRAALSDRENPQIVFIDGGSFVARGVDRDQLEARLAEKVGRKFKLVFLGLPGGNQPERRVLLEDAISLLSPVERTQLSHRNIVIMLEIHEAYDRYPLAQLARNPRSDRAYAYMRPRIAWDIFGDDHGEMEAETRKKMLEDMMVLSSSNALNAGKATRMVKASFVPPASEPMTLERPDKTFRFRGLRSSLAMVGKRDDAIVNDLPENNIRKRRERIVAAFGVREPRLVYFSVPSTRAGHLGYARAFCEKYQAESSSCITHSNRWLLRRLNHKRYWYDAGHLLKPGAAQYTRWLADRLAREMADEKREAAQ